MRLLPSPRPRPSTCLFSVLALACSVVAVAAPTPVAAAPVTTITSTWTSDDGQDFTITNHLRNFPGVDRDAAAAHEYLVVWAGDVNAADLESGAGGKLHNLPGAAGEAMDSLGRPHTPAVGPDFLAVIDVQKGAPTYGKVVNTVTVPLAENEPHHMQYEWHRGDTIFAGGLYSDVAFALDATNLPVLTLRGVNLPTDTPCGSVPDAFWTMSDGTAYGTWMGGPNLPGPCTYTNGETRMGNGFGGAPGSVVLLDRNGRTISESPAATPGMEPVPHECAMTPPVEPRSCANPHGIQLREDLNRMITGDFAQPSVIIEDPLPALPPVDVNMVRRTVRIWDISDRKNPKVVSVSRLPDGPRKTKPSDAENMGFMEVTVTNRPGHKGAFASSMCAGAIYYTPDITVKDPKWREVYDQAAVYRAMNERAKAGMAGSGAGHHGFADSGCEGSGWLQTSPDDRFLYTVTMGRRAHTANTSDPGTPGIVLSLDIRKLLAAGSDYKCEIDTEAEAFNGGAEKDCPTVHSVLPVDDPTSGGPHWGALDHFVQGPDGKFSETRDPRRLAYSNYFVARTGWDGDHKVCLVTIDDQHRLSLDRDFKDEHTGAPCVDFNRVWWPHGPWGDAKPHSMIFVVPDAAFRD
ncbi:selenium-binding protein SBP56-related protein [Sporichthya polymorpha]|uniref:selenium-binding protein SBP56-related protein n=1 Tax=Sporichthya polymorpha TaxID=35751 RepID=UPI000399CEC6|nr:selenium-binding protein SBP56-related protein [Sporichthya polymorpha]